MEVFSTIKEFGETQKETPVILSIGMFDGVHLGHQVVLQQTVEEAVRQNASPVAFTFPEHPGSFIRPGKEPPLLMDAEYKAATLLRRGMKAVIIRSFDAKLSNTEAKDFIPFLLDGIPSLAGICVGQNFRFGKKRVGDSQFLLEEGKRRGIAVRIIESKILGERPVSSSRIRLALMDGNIEEVNQMLGHPYEITGVVESGKALGRTIGFPTLNVDWNPQAKPAYGVYAGIVKSGEQVLFAVANYGLRPTLESKALTPKLEVHALDQLDPAKWRSGIEICMKLLAFIRPEKKFESLEQLKEQIAKDKRVAEEVRALN